METQEILDNHYAVHKNTSLLDILLEFEKSMDEMGIYTYKNWLEGEVVDENNVLLSNYNGDVAIQIFDKDINKTTLVA